MSILLQLPCEERRLIFRIRKILEEREKYQLLPKLKAVRRFNNIDILKVADGVMVARGIWG